MNDKNPYSASQITSNQLRPYDSPIDAEMESLLRQRLLVLRIVIGALITGVTCFGLFVMYPVAMGEKVLVIQAKEAMIGQIFCALAIMQIVASFVLPKIITDANMKKLAASSPISTSELFIAVLNSHQTATTVRGAILEAAAFLCLTGVMLYQYLPCAIMAGLLLLLMGFVFSRYGTTRDRLEQQMRSLAEA